MSRAPLLLVPLLALAVAAGTRAPAARAAAAGPLRLTVAFTADVSGYLEPCG